MKSQLVPAQPEDSAVCYGIIDAGRNFQREQGFVQWSEDYPNPETIRGDIQRGKGYVLKVDGEIAAYMCIDFEGEPAYTDIQGAWRTKEPYAVVHRMVLSRQYRGMGLTDVIFRLIEEFCRSRNVGSIRADTDFPNQRMQHILEKNGFVRCGTIVFQGSPKLAYDKSL